MFILRAVYTTNNQQLCWYSGLRALLWETHRPLQVWQSLLPRWLFLAPSVSLPFPSHSVFGQGRARSGKGAGWASFKAIVMVASFFFRDWPQMARAALPEGGVCVSLLTTFYNPLYQHHLALCFIIKMTENTGITSMLDSNLTTFRIYNNRPHYSHSVKFNNIDYLDTF